MTTSKLLLFFLQLMRVMKITYMDFVLFLKNVFRCVECDLCLSLEVVRINYTLIYYFTWEYL